MIKCVLCSLKFFQSLVGWIQYVKRDSSTRARLKINLHIYINYLRLVACYFSPTTSISPLCLTFRCAFKETCRYVFHCRIYCAIALFFCLNLNRYYFFYKYFLLLLKIIHSVVLYIYLYIYFLNDS